ncbi:MAG: leucine-rich repeat protein [Clostridia bacterium]|nr:leucine-rich repeat protein [Clostridia bacterium]
MIPVRDGYTFGGWFFNDALTAIDSTDDINIVTLYAWWTQENKAGDFTYEITDRGAIITGFSGSGSFCRIPDYIGGVAVTEIGDGAFAGCTLRSLTFPATVLVIGNRAFEGASYLEAINPKVVNGEEVRFDLKHTVSLGAYAFSGTALSHVTLPTSITKLQDGVFLNCVSLISANLNTVISMGNDTFRGCSSLTTVLLPSGLSTIGNGVFADCSSLKTLTLPASLTLIGDEAFLNCLSLETITNYLTSTKIISVGAYAFSGCEKLATVGIPRSVQQIGAYAFENCLLLDAISLGFVSVIEEGTFKGCRNLSSVTVVTPITSIGEYAFSECQKLKTVALGDSLTAIGAYAFENCVTMATISLGHNLELLGEGAFKGCSSLQAAAVSEKITVIPSMVFDGCTALKTLTWHHAVTRIEDRAFAGCTALSLDVFPSSCTYIAEEAFLSCQSLTELSIGKTLTDIAKRAFADCTSLARIRFSGTGERWKAACDEAAFEGCDNISIETVSTSYDDLRPYLTTQNASGALWSIDQTLSFNDNRPAAIITLKENSIFYRNLTSNGKVSEEYIWKLHMNGATEIVSQFTTTVTVEQFALDDKGTYGTIMLDLGEGFASLKGLLYADATLEIYSQTDPTKLLYTATLGTVHLQNPS